MTRSGVAFVSKSNSNLVRTAERISAARPPRQVAVMKTPAVTMAPIVSCSEHDNQAADKHLDR
jgi:hypothetical protein